MSPTLRGQLLADSVRESQRLIARYFKGFDDTNHTRQAPGLPNHFAWCLGHLALTLNRTAEKFDGGILPASDFLSGNGLSGNIERYDTESVCFASTPTSNASIYPSRDRCVAIFEAAISRLATALETADDTTLDSMTKWTNTQIPLWSLAVRMVFHNGVHCGQLADLRRVLGMGSIFA